MKKIDFTNVEGYIKQFPNDTQKRLEQIRALIKKEAPEAEETIGYKMPAYKLKGPLVYFAAYEKHIGFYPGAGGIKKFIREVSGYKNAKGSVQFPLDEALPLGLIGKIVKFRVRENLEKFQAKTKKSPKTKKKSVGESN